MFVFKPLFGGNSWNERFDVARPTPRGRYSTSSHRNECEPSQWKKSSVPERNRAWKCPKTRPRAQQQAILVGRFGDTPPQQALGSSKWRGDWLARTNAHSLERQTGETACVVCNGALCKPILTTQVTSPSTIRIQSFRRKSATTRCVSEPRRCRKHLLFSQFLRLSCSQKRKVLLAIALALYLQRSCRFAPIVAAVCGRPSPHTPRRRPRGYFIVNAAVMVQVSDPNEAFPCASHPLGQGRAGFYRYGPRFQAPLAGGPHVSLCEMKQHLSNPFICTDANYSLSQEPPNFFV